MGTGGVVVLLVFGQDGAQVRLVQDQGPVEEFTAQGSDVSTSTPLKGISIGLFARTTGTPASGGQFALERRSDGPKPAARRLSA